jgi:hypothetical protein
MRRDVAFDLLSLASFIGAAYSFDEAGVVKCVFKAGRGVGARMQIPDKMSVDLSHVDRGTHEPTRDRGLVVGSERDARRQLEIPSLEAVGVITSEAEPCLRSSDFEAGTSFLRRYTTVNVGREYGTRLRLSENGDVIGSFTQALLACIRQFDGGPENLGPCVNLDNRSQDRFHQV